MDCVIKLHVIESLKKLHMILSLCCVVDVLLCRKYDKRIKLRKEKNVIFIVVGLS